MARGGRGRKRSPSSVEINVTSLVDVAFTLLAIFIITAPLLQGGIEVQLPRAEAAPIKATDGVIVSIDRDGVIYLGEVRVETLEDLRVLFPQYVKDRQIRDAYLRGDRDVPYGRVVEVLGLLKSLDVAEVGLVAEEPEGKK